MELLAACWLLYVAATQTGDIDRDTRMRAADAANTIYSQVQPADQEEFNLKVRKLANILIGHPERTDTLADNLGPQCRKLGGFSE